MQPSVSAYKMSSVPSIAASARIDPGSLLKNGDWLRVRLRQIKTLPK